MLYSKTARFVLVAIVYLVAGNVFSQRNSPFSANPEASTVMTAGRQAGHQQNGEQQTASSQDRVVAIEPADPTHVYKIESGDTLQIVLQNAPNASGYYPVRADGTVDFPLAGDGPDVRGMTANQIGQMLASRVKLYRDARVQVSVREFGSHKINVSGLIERNGERFLQREAMPLFTIRADVGVRPDATRVVIRRASGVTETYRINDLRTDDVLVTAGDAIEFGK